MKINTETSQILDLVVINKFVEKLKKEQTLINEKMELHSISANDLYDYNEVKNTYDNDLRKQAIIDILSNLEDVINERRQLFIKPIFDLNNHNIKQIHVSDRTPYKLDDDYYLIEYIVEFSDINNEKNDNSIMVMLFVLENRLVLLIPLFNFSKNTLESIPDYFRIYKYQGKEIPIIQEKCMLDNIDFENNKSLEDYFFGFEIEKMNENYLKELKDKTNKILDIITN